VKTLYPHVGLWRQLGKTEPPRNVDQNPGPKFSADLTPLEARSTFVKIMIRIKKNEN